MNNVKLKHSCNLFWNNTGSKINCRNLPYS